MKTVKYYLRDVFRGPWAETGFGYTLSALLVVVVPGLIVLGILALL